MDSPIFKQISKFLQDRKSHKHWTVVFTCLAVLVCLGTVGALKLMGQAMTRKEKVLVCNMEVHAHTVECQDEAGNLICGFADYVVHVHNDDCYNSEGNLACTLPEIAAHTHSEACYAEEKVLVCGTEEVEGHVHEEACYEQQVTGLQCQTFEHQHGTGCYDEAGNLVCTAPEHQHANECYDAQGNLICGQAAHTHMVSCYDAENNLVCTAAEHQHAAECLSSENILVCGLEEGADGHAHTDECYETQKVLACGQLELHTHSAEAGCFEEVPPAEEGGEPAYNLICKTPVLEEHVHSEEAGCFEIMEAVVADAVVPEGTEAVQGTEIIAQEEVVEGTEAVDGTEIVAENETETELEEETETETEEFFKACEGDGYIVSATYGVEADIPEEAELVAELITPESDPEHYAEREAQYKEQVGDEKATMNALLKIGFYLDGEEIEPKAPVEVSVQLIDENGLPEGMPMTVVHFAEEGSRVLEGSQVEGGKTKFKTDSFSDFAFGTNRTVKISKTDTYKEKAFEITFHLEGKVELPKSATNNITLENDTENGVTDTSDAAKIEGNTENGDASVQKPEDETEITESDKQEIAEQTEISSEQTISAEQPENSTEQVNVPETETEQIQDKPESDTDETKTASPSDTDQTNVPAEESVVDETGEDATSRLVEFKVEPLAESSAEYQAIAKYAENKASDVGGEMLTLYAVAYSLTYQGEELDTSKCKVTVEVTPTKQLKNKAADDMTGAVSYLLDEKEKNLTEEQQSITGIDITGMEYAEDGTVKENGQMYMDTEMEEKELRNVSMMTTLSAGVKSYAMRAEGTPNPEFTVQYYAYLDKVDWKGNQTGNAPGTQITKDNVGHPEAWGAAPSGLLKGYRESISKGYMPIIDTSDKNGGDLPQNGVIPNLNSIQLDTDGSIKMIEKDLTAVYEERRFEYHKAPTINYFNALIENASYDLTEVWITSKGESDSTDPSDWTVYKDEKLENLHFTNRKETHDKYPDKYILIDSNTVIRLVYDTNKGNRNSPATFYDYDIGEMAGAYWQINNKGINSPSNYVGTDKSKAKYAFGNNNAVDFDGTQDVANKKTGLGEEQIISEDNLTKSRLNMGNWYAGVKDGQPLGSYGYAGCTFGLVTGSAGNNVVFHNKIDAPEVFGSSKNVEGKTIYQGDSEQNYSLDFLRNGDTYTLTGVRGTNAQNLEKFKTPVEKYQYIKTNSFWPMDGVSGADGKNGPASDESGNTIKEHNNYFGMYYAVSFELDPEYIGPLEYLFFGDDDMWVFLDDSTLVCDIGGVHSSVGEYVDLWDHLHKHTSDCFNDDNDLTCTLGSHKHTDACYAKDDQGNKELTCTRNKHTLKFFYTERGASGSSCWMQFTIPSVSSMTPETTDEDFGHLEVDKKVFITSNGKDYLVNDIFDKNQQQATLCNEKEFTFTISLQGLVDDYAYVKYDRDGNPIETTNGSGILAWDTIAHGETFTLKDGEYISIRYLPAGTHYTITEEKEEGEGKTGVQIQGIVYDSTNITVDQNSTITGLQADGDIQPNKTSKVHYVNKYNVYELPETGGTGKKPYTMAGVIVMFGAGLLYRRKFRERRV